MTAFAEAAISETGRRKMFPAAKAMTMSAVGLLLSPDAMARVTAMFGGQGSS